MNTMNQTDPTWKTWLLTLLALTAFAANSLLCRMALGDQSIDAASFTAIRLFSGALTLLLLVSLTMRKNRKRRPSKGSWLSGAMLFAYAACFSYAYMTLDTGTGALILFASVQITMISYSFFQGRTLSIGEWTGVALAFSGFLYLVSPGVSAPPIKGFLLMTLSGVGWGMYSVRGKSSTQPLEDTAFNFARSLPLAFLLSATALAEYKLSAKGMVLAIGSGAITSGLGYTIWYMALRGLSNVEASVVQLFVPALAALGGVLFLSETLTSRLLLSSVIILGGILLTITSRSGSKSGNDT